MAAFSTSCFANSRGRPDGLFTILGPPTGDLWGQPVGKYGRSGLRPARTGCVNTRVVDMAPVNTLPVNGCVGFLTAS
jgi:hypothetical protein